ncbi:MAG: Mrp/NBP35 family ATP-binding protein, partial [Fimbriimonadaceae bacterium]|nr:Mrp/NBP35 family ATP-binding protein [Fimbriimonadaceae bacterium]
NSGNLTQNTSGAFEGDFVSGTKPAIIPGTGDAPMSLAQLVPLTGVVLVTTPHSVAANIAGKAAALFKRLNSPILGVVENMSEFVCPNCGHVTRIFSGMTGAELAEQLKTPYLGTIPLDPMVGEASDSGLPSVIAYPDRPQAAAFKEVGGKLAAQVSVLSLARQQAQESTFA